MFYVENVKCLLFKYMLAWLVEGEGGRAYLSKSSHEMPFYKCNLESCNDLLYYTECLKGSY